MKLKNTAGYLGSALVVLLASAPVSADEMAPGLTLIEAGATKVAATYSSPHASVSIEAVLVDGMIESTVRDQRGHTVTAFRVPVLEGDELVARYQTMAPKLADRLVREPIQSALYQKASFGVVWSFVQMSEEITLRLSGSDVPRAVRAALRLHPNLLGMLYEHSSANAAAQLPQKIPAVFSEDNNCNGACGPGCDWCIGVPFTDSYLCETSAFCVLHDAYCGAWEDFFDCDFGSCDIL